MDLFMYNMQFGECFLLSGKCENLIVDCGSDAGGFDYGPVIGDLAARSDGKAASLLLTHFHLDHLAGVLEPRFPTAFPDLSRIYLPNLLGVQVPRGFDLLKSNLFYEIMNGVMLRKRDHVTLGRLLRMIAGTHTRLTLLERGKSFDCDRTQYHVLWPDIHKVNRVSARILADFMEWRERTGRRGLFDRMDAYETVLVDAYRRLTELNGDYAALLRDGTLERVEEAEDAMWTAAEEFAARLDEEGLRRARALANQLKHCGNRLSIVFHDAAGTHGNGFPILMTGDVPRSIFDKEILPQLHDSYCVVKAPHHGTATYFTFRLPDCGTIAISNGDPASGHGRFGKISDKYQTVYAGRGPFPTALRCSNPRCRALSLLGRSCGSHRQCGIPSGQTCIGL